MNWIGMEGECERASDKYSPEENVFNGRLEIWSRYMQIDGIDHGNDLNEMVRRREYD